MDDSAVESETKAAGFGANRLGLARLPLQAAPWVAAAAAALFWLRRRTGKAQAAPFEPPPLTPELCEAAEPGRGRCARAPWTIPARGWKDIFWRMYEESGRNRLVSLAGGVTFFLLLATFPAIAAFVSIYGLFLNLGTVAKLLVQLSHILPQDAVNLIGGQMIRLTSQKHATLGAAFAISTLASIWSANAGMKALFDGVNAAYGEEEKRPYLGRTLFTYGATLVTVVFLVSVTLLTVAAPVYLQAQGVRVWFLITPMRWLTVYLLAACAFTRVYRLGPSRARARWRWVACGGAGAALFWMAGSIGFSLYLNNFAHFGATYGSLGAMIGFMLWVWFSVMVILAGANLNAEIEHQTAQDTTVGPPAPIGRRGAVMADTVGRAFTVSPRQARDYAADALREQAVYWTDLLRRWVRP